MDKIVFPILLSLLCGTVFSASLADTNLKGTWYILIISLIWCRKVKDTRGSELRRERSNGMKYNEYKV